MNVPGARRSLRKDRPVDVGAAVAEERSFPAHAEALADVRLFVRDIAKASSFPEAAVVDLVLAVSEACTLFLRGSASSLTIRCSVSVGQVAFDVSDQGEPDLNGPRAASTVVLIKRLVDAFEIIDGSAGDPLTHIRLTKRFG